MSRRRNPLPFHAGETHRLLTTSEVAEYWRVTPLTVRRWIQQGKLRAVRVGRDYRIIGRDAANDLWAIRPKPIPRGREFTTKEAAALLCVSARFLRNEIQAGKLAVIVRRHRYVITSASLVRYAKARRGRA